jgi:hypothetical protein
MVYVLRSGRFTLYLVVMTGFYFIYNQVYNVLPLYVKKVVETAPAMDLYTAANPFVIGEPHAYLLPRGMQSAR